VTAAVLRIAPARYQPALLEVIEQPNDVARVEAQGFGERLLGHRALLLEQPERDEVTRTKATGGHGSLSGPAPEAREVVQQGQEPLFLVRPGRAHQPIVHS